MTTEQFEEKEKAWQQDKILARLDTIQTTMMAIEEYLKNLIIIKMPQDFEDVVHEKIRREEEAQ